jgi:type I restriction enzyme M protein
MLLKEKWINPLESKLLSLSDSIISTLCDKIKTLSEKYKDTFSSVEAEIASTSKELSDLIDNLTGSEYDMQGLKEFKQLIQG